MYIHEIRINRQMAEQERFCSDIFILPSYLNTCTCTLVCTIVLFQLDQDTCTLIKKSMIGGGGGGGGASAWLITRRQRPMYNHV